jgi:hypothetical protein
MSATTDSDYFTRRARTERGCAAAAADPRAASAHFELAARYEALASDPSLDLPVRRDSIG